MNRKTFINLLAAGLFLLPLLAPLQNGLWLPPHLFKYLLSGPIIILLLSLYLLNNGFAKHCRLIKTPANYLGLAFLLWALASIFWAHNTYNAWLLWFQYLMAFLMFLLVLNTLHSKQDIIKILLAIFLSGVVVSFVGILQHSFDFSMIRQANPPGSFFGNKNIAVHFIILSLPIGLGLAVDTQKSAHKLFYSIGVSIMICFLFFTKTRAGWLAFSIQALFAICFLGWILFKEKEKFKLKIKYGFAVVLFFLLVPVTILMLDNSKVNALSNITYNIAHALKIHKTSTIKIRIHAWRKTMHMVYDNPVLGTGLANWSIHYPLYNLLYSSGVFHKNSPQNIAFNEKTQFKNPHNDYLVILSELGITGFLILLVMALFIMKKIWRILKNPHHTMRYLIFSLAIALVGFLINAGFTFPLSVYLPPIIILIYFAVILLADSEAFGDNSVQLSNDSYRLPKKLTLSIGVISFFISIYYSYHNFRHIKAEDLYYRAEALEKKNHWQELHRVALQSYILNPNRTRISAYVGQAKMHLGQTQEAIKYFTQALSLVPYNINTMSFFATAYISIGDYKNAEKMYLRGLEIYPDWANTHKNIGVLYLNNLKQPKQAIKHLQIALELDPDIEQAETIRRLINTHPR